jgi:outer membrane cobalamin receptor
VALIWGLNDNNYFKFMYGEAINRPSFFQLTDVLFFPGIAPLEPETIQTFEFNYIGTLSPKFTVSASVFRNMLDKLIFRTLFVIGGEITSRYANVGEMTTTGAELTITAKPSEKFTLELSGTYQDTKDKREGFEDIEVGYAPKLLGYVKASLFLNKDISIAVSGTYVDKMESYYDSTITIPGRLGTPVDAYFLLGANLRIRNLFGTGMFLNIRGSNLLDKEIRYPTTSFNNLFATDGTVGRGISFLATLGFRLIPFPRP